MCAAFLAPPRWEGSVVVPGTLLRHPVTAAFEPPRQQEDPVTIGSTSPLFLLGALFLLGRQRRQKVATARKVWGLWFSADGGKKVQGTLSAEDFKETDWPDIGSNSRARGWRLAKDLKHYVKKDWSKRCKRMKQKVIWQESNIWMFMDKWKNWDPMYEQRNLYKGPESHPDNPWFPDTSPGWNALRGWAPGPMSSSAVKGTSSTFVAGRRPGLVSNRGFGRPASAVVMHAHKKAASSCMSQGKGGPTVKRHGMLILHGKPVKAGSIISCSKGTRWHAGVNVTEGRTNTLHSLKEGIAQWRGNWKHRECSIIPYDYIERKCFLLNKFVYPQKYEPWMGNVESKEHYIKMGYNGNKIRGGGHMASKSRITKFQDRVWMSLYDKWEQSPAGIAHFAKRDEKEERSKQYAKITYAKRAKKSKARALNRGDTGRDGAAREVVRAGDSESETEA